MFSVASYHKATLPTTGGVALLLQAKGASGLKEWAKGFYSSAVWAHTRAAYLASGRGLCERCAAQGRTNPAAIVHHKKYLTPANIKDTSISLAWDNLEALCQACHNAEHHGTTSTTTRYTFDACGQLVPK